MAKTIVIDARMVSNDGHGIGRYVEELVEALVSCAPEWSSKYKFHFLISVDLTRKSIFDSLPVSRVQAPFLSPRGWIEVPAVLKRLHADLYHNPSFEAFPWLPVPHISTVHDLNHLDFGDFSKRIYYSFVLKPFLNQAAGVLTVSKTMQLEISKWLGWTSDRIGVIPNAVQVVQPSDVEVSATLKKYGLFQGRFLLAVGTSKPHKNLSFLLRLHRHTSDILPLAVTLNQKELENNCSPAIALDSLPTMELFCLMKAARALVFPTLYEGYGRPPVEALMLGTPVVVSDIPVLREVLQDACVTRPDLQSVIHFCPVNDEESWTRELLNVSSADQANFLPLEQVVSLEEFAKRHLKAYAKALQN